MANLKAYEQHLERFRNRSPLFFQIGIGYPQSVQPPASLGMGGSLEVFSDWLGCGSRVFGINILVDCVEMADPTRNISVEIGSQTDLRCLDNVLLKHVDPDLILDDGSLNDLDALETFNYLFPLLMTGVVYIIEDCGGIHFRESERQAKNNYVFQDRLIFKCFQLVLQMIQFYAKNFRFKSEGVEQEPFVAQNIGFMIKNVSSFPILVIFPKGNNVPIDPTVAPAHYIF